MTVLTKPFVFVDETCVICLLNSAYGSLFFICFQHFLHVKRDLEKMLLQNNKYFLLNFHSVAYVLHTLVALYVVVNKYLSFV